MFLAALFLTISLQTAPTIKGGVIECIKREEATRKESLSRIYENHERAALMLKENKSSDENDHSLLSLKAKTLAVLRRHSEYRKRLQELEEETRELVLSVRNEHAKAVSLCRDDTLLALPIQGQNATE